MQLPIIAAEEKKKGQGVTDQVSSCSLIGAS